MKIILLTFLTALLANAADPKVIISLDEKDKFIKDVWLVAATKKAVRYKERPKSNVFRDLSLRTVDSIYFYEPTDFTEAMNLYKTRDYAGARTKFAAVAKANKEVEELEGNFSTLAKFYEMECARHLEDWEGLSKLGQGFIPDALLHEEHKKQIEINTVFWEALRSKSWPRIIAIANDPKWQMQKLSGRQRIQIAYCLGLAYEGAKKPIKALNSYNHALVGDFAASEVIVRKVALNCMRIIKDHEDVKLAISLFGTEDYSETSNGAFLIKEGHALTELWDKTLGSGAKLPAEYKMFEKYLPKK